MSLRGPRKRIAYKSSRLLPIEDELAYTKNKCSERARKINSINPNLVFDVWFDQHLHIRQQFGDDKGLREGIGQYALEIFENESVLKRMERGRIIEVYRL